MAWRAQWVSGDQAASDRRVEGIPLGNRRPTGVTWQAATGGGKDGREGGRCDEGTGVDESVGLHYVSLR